MAPRPASPFFATALGALLAAPPMAQAVEPLIRELPAAQEESAEKEALPPAEEPVAAPTEPVVAPVAPVRMSEGPPPLPIDDIGLESKETAPDIWKGSPYAALRDLLASTPRLNDPLLERELTALLAAKAVPPEGVAPQGTWLRLRLGKLFAEGESARAKQMLDLIPGAMRDAHLDGIQVELLLAESPLADACETARAVIAERPSAPFQRLGLLCHAAEKNLAALDLNLTLLEEQGQTSEASLGDMLRRAAEGKPGKPVSLPSPPSLLLVAATAMAGTEIQETSFAGMTPAALALLAHSQTAHPTARALAWEELAAEGRATAAQTMEAYQAVEAKGKKGLAARAAAASALGDPKSFAAFKGKEKLLAALLSEQEPAALEHGALAAMTVRHAALFGEPQQARAWLEANRAGIEETRRATLELALHLAEHGGIDEAALEPFLSLDGAALKGESAARVAAALALAETLLPQGLPELLTELKASAAAKAGVARLPETAIQELLESAHAKRRGETSVRLAAAFRGGAWRQADAASLASAAEALKALGLTEESAALCRNMLLKLAI